MKIYDHILYTVYVHTSTVHMEKWWSGSAANLNHSERECVKEIIRHLFSTLLFSLIFKAHGWHVFWIPRKSVSISCTAQQYFSTPDTWQCGKSRSTVDVQRYPAWFVSKWKLGYCSYTVRQEPSIDAKQTGIEASNSCFPMHQGHTQWARQNNATVAWEHPRLAQCLGTGHIRHLEPCNCQETQTQQDRFIVLQNTDVSDDSCQQRSKDEMLKCKNVTLQRKW